VYLTPDEFRAKVSDFKRSAFRLESRQNYNVPGDQADLARFLAGEPKPEERKKDLYESVRSRVADGMAYTKVKVLRRPLTDYQRWFLAWAIPDSIEAGMEYRVIDITDREVDLPDLDFWLYDDSTVVVLDYHEDDSPKGAELIESHIDQYRLWRDIAMRESLQFSEYRA
jgi:hypothetical protein